MQVYVPSSSNNQVGFFGPREHSSVSVRPGTGLDLLLNCHLVLLSEREKYFIC